MRKVGNKMNDEKIKKIVQDCIESQDESEWFEFKENAFLLKLLKSYNIIQREGANKNGYCLVLI